MSSLKPETVREAYALTARANETSNPQSLVTAAQNLRRIGRPDLALHALGRIRQAMATYEEWQLQLCLTYAALGRHEDAVQTIRAMRQTSSSLPATLELIALFNEMTGVVSVNKANIRRLLTETVSTDDPTAALSTFPLKALGRIAVGRLIEFATATMAPEARTRFLARALGLKVKYRLFDVAAGLLFALVRLRYLRRGVQIASLGNFTRLADIVDRLDPALRRSRRQAGNGTPPLLIAFYYDGYPNQTLIRLYSRHCRLIFPPGRLAKSLSRRAYGMLQQVGRNLELTTDYRYINEDFISAPPVIHFLDAEARTAEKQLSALGIDMEKPIVCFGLRDMAYYKFYGTVAGAGSDAGSRNSTAHRCPPIDSYIDFARFWAERGHQVLRMGLRVTDPLPSDLPPLVFDYAMKGRSDELDAYLFSRCKFLLAGDTGLFSGSAAFDRPAVVSDLFLVRNTIYSSNKTTRNIFIPKLVFDQEQDRYLSFAEWIYFNHLFSFSEDCERARFKLIHNSPEDLIDATRELTDRLDGRFEETDEDRTLQNRFHDIYAPYQVGYGSTGRVATGFLRKYAHLLD